MRDGPLADEPDDAVRRADRRSDVIWIRLDTSAMTLTVVAAVPDEQQS